MNQLLKVMVLLVAAGSFAVFSVAQEPQTPATKHVLKGTYVNTGNYNASIAPATYIPIDTALTITCPGTGTCTIEADMWIDFHGNGGSGNAAAICLVVDGVQTAGCPFEALEVPPDGSRIIGSLSQPLSGVAPGNHTVQTFAYASGGAFVQFFTANYRVYTP